MPTDRITVALAIAEQNANILVGSIYAASITRPTRVTVAASSDDADIGIGVQFGSRSMCIATQMTVPVEPGVLQGPRIPEDVIIDEVVAPLENVVISMVGGVGVSVSRVLVNYNEG